MTSEHQGDSKHNQEMEDYITDSLKSDSSDDPGHFQAIFDQVETALIVVDNNLNIQSINQNAMQLLLSLEDSLKARWPSFNAAELIGESFEQLHFDISNQKQSLLNPKNSPYTLESKFSDRFLEFKINSLISENEIKGFTISLRDTTERKKIQHINLDFQSQIDAISKSQAVIEFDLDGNIVDANENFLAAVGYALEEIKGRHHAIFVTQEEASTDEYTNFWKSLRNGEFHSGEFRRVNKSGDDIWIQATYNPLFDEDGKPYKIVKYASDITQAKNISADADCQIQALHRANAVIEFKLDGTILSANDNFLSAMGYSLEEIKDHHHSMFVEPSYAVSQEYKSFWASLAAGEFQSGEYKRLGKGGKEVWIQASYNPIFDLTGKPIKVAKYATDITETKLKAADMRGQIKAIHNSQAVIEFELDGVILTANDNFLTTMGYSLEEIQGRHHSMFVEESYAASIEYRKFWDSLARGEFAQGEFKRIARNGTDVWIAATYNPIFDMDGKPFKVVKYADCITEAKNEKANFEGQISAISKSQAVVEFNMDGSVSYANDNFLETTGYVLDEVIGSHHSMFVDPAEAQSAEYRAFWDKLNRGDFESDVYRRINRSGDDIWIRASYNPIFDLNGKPFKVVEYATDITEQKRRDTDFEGQISAIAKSQAVIEFNMDGTVIKANENFLNAVGYTLPEIQGQHHSMFVDRAYARSMDYRLFWEKLNNGEFDAGEYCRFDKQGNEVWIQASYNPIFDTQGKPIKVVKYASDITDRKTAFKEISETLGDLAEGDLSVSLDMADNAEFLELSTNINAFISKLSEIVTSIKGSSSNVAKGVNDIAKGNSNLSSRTEQQAASLEQTASSMDEIATTVQLTAENAGRANELVIDAQNNAIRGGEVVDSAVAAMSEINDASARIAEIISVIDEIAFQTNLLALNASVEAARAGEQGRGFAVVASEVRNLAGRSATAAKEIKDLIEDSVRKVEDGSNLVSKSGETLKDIVSAVKNVTNIVGEITTATDEQSTGISEIHREVAQLQRLTQQNTAMVEEAAAASEDLGSQAYALDDLVGFFRIDEDEERRSSVERREVVERRSSDRPWSSSASEEKSASNDPVQSVANADFDGNWKDF